jgi:flavin-dependent dehydrogenase
MCLARAGAHVALIDRRSFPRDKACGDLIGPRGVRLLEEFGLSPAPALPVGDLIVVGPSGRRIRLPALPGLDYPGHALAIPRVTFDSALFDAAVCSGARPLKDVFVGLTDDPSVPMRIHLASGRALTADAIVGADGATSQVAAVSGLVNNQLALWGFALRAYVEATVDLPHIVFWEPRRWRTLPGYGWIFPSADGGANLGLGIGVGSDRLLARAVGERFHDFWDHLVRLRIVQHRAPAARERLGGWLKTGVIGTVPARGRVLLAGDAAGLINPLQGEGIAQAMASGQAAAAAILEDGPADAAIGYRHRLRAISGHHRINAPVHRAAIGHPKSVSAVGRVLTAPLVRNAVAGTWSLYWNDLVRGAGPSPHRAAARGTTHLVKAIARTRKTDAWFDEAL